MIANQRGQMVVEYILLLVIAVAMAFTLRTVFVKGAEKPEDAGVVLKAWDAMEQAIGEDDPNHR